MIGVDNMDEKDWNAIRILYEEKNISRASERLYISQPALTYRLKNLEKEFGTRYPFSRLLRRNDKKVAENERLYVKYAK